MSGDPDYPGTGFPIGKFVRVEGSRITDALNTLVNDINSAVVVSGGAPLDSPAFTGVPTAPTAAPGTNTTQLATTAFVISSSGSAPYEILLPVPSGGDDTTTIQTALNTISALGGGKVFLRPASYRSNATITIPNKVYLEGSGLGCDVYQLPFDYTNKEFAIYADVTGTTHAIQLNGGMKNVTILQDRVRTLGNPATRAQMATYVNGFTGYGVRIGDGTNPGPSNNTDMENVIIGGFTRGINTVFSSQDRKKHVFIDCINGYFLDNSHDDDKNDHIECWEFLTTSRAGTFQTWIITSIADNGSGVWRLTIGAHDLLAGEVIHIRPGTGGQGIVGRWVVASPTATTIDLTGSAVSVANSGTTVSGNTYVTVASTTNIRRGMAISGTGIAASTFVAGVWADRNSISMTLPATASGTNTLTYTSPAYTGSSTTAQFDANYRSGIGFNISNSEGPVFNEAFAFAYENGFVLDSVISASILSSHTDGGHNVTTVTGAAIRFSNASYNNYFQGGLINGGYYGVINDSSLVTNLPNTVVSNRWLADGVLAQVSRGGLILEGVGTNDPNINMLVDDSGRLSLLGGILPTTKIYGESEVPPWSPDPELSGANYWPTRRGTVLSLKSPVNPFILTTVDIAALNEKVFKINILADGAVTFQGLSDDLLTSLNYFNLTRPNGIVSGVVELSQPLRSGVQGGVAPTGSATGAGTGPVVTFGGGSNANAGVIVLTTGTGSPAALGTLTLTFAVPWLANNPVVSLWPQDTGADWDPRATAWMDTQSLTAPVFKWNNNGVALAASTAYHFGYLCLGK
jgi:hypothetical protein